MVLVTDISGKTYQHQQIFGRNIQIFGDFIGISEVVRDISCLLEFILYFR